MAKYVCTVSHTKRFLRNNKEMTKKLDANFVFVVK